MCCCWTSQRPSRDKFTPYLLGFDASEDAVPERAIGIHHPNGNVKRISYANSRQAPSSSRNRKSHYGRCTGNGMHADNAPHTCC